MHYGTVEKSNPIESPASPSIDQGSPLEKLQKDTDVLLMLYPKNIKGYYSEIIDPEDEIKIYTLLNEKNETKKNILILLDTSGGNVYSALKIMDTLRLKYSKITIAIPQQAKSSGTMMCCGADEIIMSSISELGPLDKPMPHPEDETANISALDIIKSIDGMIDTSTERNMDLAKSLSHEFALPLNKCLEISSRFVTDLMSPMLCREDVKIYNQAKRLLGIAEKYASELLTKNMLEYIKDDKLRQRLADLIVRQFVWLYPDHAFAIRRNELKDWFFTVRNAEECDFWDELWSEYMTHLVSHQGKQIRFL